MSAVASAPVGVRRVRVARFGRAAFELFVLAAVYLLLTRAVAWSLFEPGWFENHERIAMFERVEAYRRAFVAHDFVPLWSPLAQNGHGSPMPLFYHRFFNSFAALWALKIGAYRATKLSILLFIAFGSLGMHRAARTLGVGTPLRFAAGALFATAPYLLTEWLVRGAVAELTAMAIVPWLLEATIRFSRGERVGIRLGLLASALYFAHSMICFFALPLLVVAGVVSIVHAPGEDVPRGMLRVLGAGLQFSIVFLSFTAPFLVAVFLVRGRYSFNILEAIDPTREFVPVGRYLIDSGFEWGVEARLYSVEIGAATMALLAAVVFAIVLTRTRVWNGPVAFMSIAFGMYAVLLHPKSAPLYRVIPGASLLQFPWRLLVFLVPLAVLLVCVLGQSLLRAHRSATTALVAGVAFVVIFQFLTVLDAQKITYARELWTDIDAKLTNLDGPNYGEYLPVGARFAPARAPFVSLQGCTAAPGTSLPAETEHFRRVDLTVVPTGVCTVSFSQFCAPLLEVSASRGEVGCTTDGTFKVTIPPGPPVRVRLARRSMWNLLRTEWSKRKAYGM